MSMKTVRILLVATIVLPLASCERAWNAVNSSALEADVASLLDQCGLEDRVPEACSMICTNRDGICEFDLMPAEVAQLVEQLGLSELDSTDTEHLDVLNRLQMASPSCVGQHENTEALDGWIVLGRPPELTLKSGTSFEYFLIIYKHSESRACLQLSYAYG